MHDRRIGEIAALIDSGRYDLLSLDIFDTVVWRMVPAPSDVFFLVAHRLFAEGAIHDSSTPESFVKQRIGAEERARKKRRSREVTFADIYAEFPRGYLLGVGPERAAELELEIEGEVVRVNPDLRTLIERARARGMTTAFVSDTYFTTAQIRRLVGIEVDHLLLSGEAGLSKYQGLHRLLIERSGVEPSRILHVGDNHRADIEGPEVLGIERFWFQTWPEAYEDLLSLEMPATLSGRADYLRSHDGGLTALRSRAMAAAADEYERWGAGILGPVVAGFGDWVTAKCRSAGIRPVLCLMREGRVFKETLDLLGSGLEAHEFYASRYAARKAAIYDADERELLGFVARPSAQKRGVILAQLGLSPADLGGENPDELLTPKETVLLVRRIAADRALRRKVARDCARARAGWLAHLESLVGDIRGQTVAVVDLGYKGTIQACLQTILDREGWGTRTHGLYLVTGGEVHETQATGAVVEGWLAENGQPIAMAHTFMRSPEIVEQSLMASCGTTLGHAVGGEPVLDAFRAPEEQREQIVAVQRGLLSFVSAWSEHRSAFGIGDMSHWKPVYQALCIRSVARPLPVELELFGDWVHDENFGSADARGLAQATGLDEWELAHMSAHQLASLPMARLYWPFGLAHRISPVMGEAVASIYLRAADPGAFDSAHRTQHMVVYWDTGRGFNPEEASIRPYRINNRGKVWQRVSLQLGGNGSRARQVGFSIGTKDQVLDLTGIAVHGGSENGDHGTAKLTPDQIQKLGYRHLGRNLYLVEEDPSLLVVSMDAVPPDTDQVVIDLFFGVVVGD
jgi:predicted HAD superfamily hydrolase